MADQTISESYKDVCGKHGIRINLFVLENLQKMSTTRSPCLKLAGNRRQGGCQKLCDDDVFALSKCLHCNQTVTALDLSYNNVGDRGAGHLADLLEVGNQEENSALLYLDLTFNNIGAKGAELLSIRLKANSLVSLRLSLNKVGEVGALHLAHMLPVNWGLQVLYLHHCDLDISSLIAFGIAIENNQTLRSIDLSRPLQLSLQEEWATHFSKMFAVNTSLVELHLGKMGLTDTGMERLAEGLKRNHTLRYLDLRCNHVSHDGALYLASVLKEKTAIEILNLSTNCIEDIGAGYLSDAISRPGCVLRELSVCTNNIRTQGLCSLAPALKNNPTLTHLYIWGNHPKEPACRAFRELISSGRLPPQNTDVESYEQDGHVFLAEAFHGLRKSLYQADGNVTDATVGSASDGAPEDGIPQPNVDY